MVNAKQQTGILLITDSESQSEVKQVLLSMYGMKDVAHKDAAELILHQIQSILLAQQKEPQQRL